MVERKKTRPIFYLVLVIIPILFFVLLELILQTFDYGYNTETWIKVGDTHYSLNPDVARRYFSNVENVPESIQDVFEIDKRENTFRVFVLGGSSAAGFPYMPLGAFSRYIRQRLETNYPDKNIEVINLGLSAVNSYTVLDLVSSAVSQKPDLILLYLGHNEYYGALGVGSMESLGKSRTFVNLIVKLNNFKTTQLIRNIIQSFFELFANNKPQSGTLMSRMAQKKKIELNSETYNRGLTQFKNNILDILKIIQSKNVPVILSTVVSNLKDQPPFISGAGNAISIYQKAQKEFSSKMYVTADSLFTLAKDLDMLRFRAPSDINRILLHISDSLNLSIVRPDIDLSNISPGNIIGNNLMVDHLHLSLRGYQELGKIFYNKISELKLLPKEKPKYDPILQDSITIKYFKFSKLDSTISDFQIRMLKNDWPFVQKKDRKPISEIITINNFVDSIAFSYVSGKEEWEKSHRIIAYRYLQLGDIENFKESFDILIHQYPLTEIYYKIVAEQLINHKKYNEAIVYLKQGNELNENAFYTKWLGIINLYNGDLSSAIKYLNKSLTFNRIDSQVLYNLSGAYAKNKDFKRALESVNRCLSINPKFNSAVTLKKQLENLIN